MTSGEMSSGSLTDERVSAIASTASVRTADRRHFPDDVRVGGRDVVVPDRRRSRRDAARASGTASARSPGRSSTAATAMSPAATTSMPAGDVQLMTRTRPRRLPVLDLLAAGHPRRARRRRTGGARLLRPARRPAARRRHRPVRHAVSLGPAPGVGGRGRVAGAGDRVPLRRVRRRRRHRPRRSRQALGHAQRAVLLEPLRLRHRVHGPGPHVGRRRLRRRPPPVARPWPGRRAAARPCPRRRGRDRLELQPDASGERRPGRRRRGGGQGRPAQPLVSPSRSPASATRSTPPATIGGPPPSSATATSTSSPRRSTCSGSTTTADRSSTPPTNAIAPPGPVTGMGWEIYPEGLAETRALAARAVPLPSLPDHRERGGDGRPSRRHRLRRRPGPHRLPPRPPRRRPRPHRRGTPGRRATSRGA